MGGMEGSQSRALGLWRRQCYRTALRSGGFVAVPNGQRERTHRENRFPHRRSIIVSPGCVRACRVFDDARRAQRAQAKLFRGRGSDCRCRNHALVGQREAKAVGDSWKRILESRRYSIRCLRLSLSDQLGRNCDERDLAHHLGRSYSGSGNYSSCDTRRPKGNTRPSLYLCLSRGRARARSRSGIMQPKSENPIPL